MQYNLAMRMLELRTNLTPAINELEDALYDMRKSSLRNDDLLRKLRISALLVLDFVGGIFSTVSANLPQPTRLDLLLGDSAGR